MGGSRARRPFCTGEQSPTIQPGLAFTSDPQPASDTILETGSSGHDQAVGDNRRRTPAIFTLRLVDADPNPARGKSARACPVSAVLSSFGFQLH